MKQPTRRNRASSLWWLPAALLACAIAGMPGSARAEGAVRLKDLLGEMFAGSEKVKKVTATPDEECRKRVAKALGLKKLRAESFAFYVGETKGKRDGFAIVLDEMGKYQPITFLVGLDAAGNVKMVEILKYREPVGGEIRDSRFRKQYLGKGESDSITLGRDIKNISGATISCRAISRGVKKAVHLVNEIFLAPATEPERPGESGGPETSEKKEAAPAG